MHLPLTRCCSRSVRESGVSSGDTAHIGTIVPLMADLLRVFAWRVTTRGPDGGRGTPGNSQLKRGVLWKCFIVGYPLHSSSSNALG